MKDRYGVEYGMQIDGFKEKSKATMLYRYGVESPLASSEILAKTKATNVKRYGVSNVLSSGSPIREKRDDSMRERYGAIAPMQNQMLKEKTLTTIERRYGVTNAGLVHTEDNEELTLDPILRGLGFIHNDMDKSKHKTPLMFRFKNEFGHIVSKCPDYINYESKIVVEYNGSYWHQDPEEQNRWLRRWTSIGWKIAVIWDFEQKDFMEDPPETVEELLISYPCTYRKDF